MLQTPSFQTKVHYAYATLRDAILCGHLGPGEKPFIDRLSAEMGLSQILDLLRLRDADALEKLAATHNREANRSYLAMLK